MRKIFAIAACTLALAVAGLMTQAVMPSASGPIGASAPIAPLGPTAAHAASRSVGGGSGGGGQAKQAGQRAADLIKGWAAPLLFVLVGVIALVALGKREIGLGVTAVFGGLLAGAFLLDPAGMQSFFKSIYSAIF
jgi:hypothetical protein